MKTCQHCGKHFLRGYNLQRHKNSSCPMISRESEEQNISIEYPEYHYEHEEMEDDNSIEEMGDESQSDEEMSDADVDDDMSDTDSEDSDAEHEDSVWVPIIEEAKARHHRDYKELVQKLLDDGVDQEGAKEKGYHHILHVLQREARNIYLENLKWMREFRRDPVHRKVMETKQSFVEDGFDGEEALEAAVNKSKFLLNKIFEDDDGYDESDEEDNEDYY